MRRSTLTGLYCFALLLVACNDLLQIRSPSEQIWSPDAATDRAQASNADQAEDAGQ